MKRLLLAMLLIGAAIGTIYLVNRPSPTTNNTVASTVTTSETTKTEESTEVTTENCVSDQCLEIEELEYPVDSELPDAVIDALKKALDDEYKAYAVYESVIDSIGQVRPFSMIIRAEENHASQLKSLFDKYGIPIPENSYLNNVTVADSRTENCTIGVDAEIANVSLYKDNLLSTVANYPDITQVFTNLMNASQDKHLPAFSRCAA